MEGWKSWKKKARKQARRGWKEARERLDRLREETAPERERLGREARRRTPQLLALLLATAREMSRDYPPRPEAGRKRSRRGWKLLLLAAAAAGLWWLLRPRED
jgi:hypothetical protein